MEGQTEAPGPAHVRWLLWWRAMRPFSWPCSLLPAMIAAAAAAPPGQWAADRLLAALLAVVSLHTAGNMLNDYLDYVHGVDHRTEGNEGRPGRLLVTGQLRPRQVLHGTAAAWGVALLATGYLAARGDWFALPFAAAGAAAAYCYSGPPLNLKAHGLGEVTILCVFGPALMAAVALVVAGQVPAVVLALSVPVGLAVSLVLAANNLRDLEEDASAGVRTLAHRLGRRRMAALFAAAAVACPFAIAAAGLAHGRPAVALALTALPFAGGPIRAVMEGRRLPNIDVRMARYTAALLFLTVAGLLASGAW